MPVAVLNPAAENIPLRDIIAPVLARMMERAAFGTEAEVHLWSVFDALTRDSLASSATAKGSRFSGICRDGSPWQFCTVLGAANPAPVRFLTEVGRRGDALPLRTACAVQAIAEAMALGDYPPTHVLDRLARATPQDDQHFAGLWIGVAAGAQFAPRFRVYSNIGWGSDEQRWLRMISLLGYVGAQGFARHVDGVLGLLMTAFQPAGFALTMPHQKGHVKIYFRPFASPWPTVLQLANAVCGAMGRQLIAQIEAGFRTAIENLPWRSLVLSLSGPADGSAWDIKIDLCCHCLFSSGEKALAAVSRLAGGCGLDSTPLSNMLGDMGSEPADLDEDAVAFVGIGANHRGVDRINVYFSHSAVSRQLRARADGYRTRRVAL